MRKIWYLGRPRRSLLAQLRTNFLTGIVVIAPVGMTVWLVWTVAGWVDGVVLPFLPDAYHPEQLFKRLLGPDTRVNIRGIGVVMFLLFTVATGWAARGYMGRSLIGWGEYIVNRMPVVRTIYTAVKQIVETVFAEADRSFQKACLIEYPRRGIWAIGFVATTARQEIARSVGVEDEMLSVFVPTTPNPTSGFLLFFPRKDVIELDMSVEDAAKLVISAGLVYPTPDDKPVSPSGRTARRRRGTERKVRNVPAPREAATAQSTPHQH